MKTYNAPSVEIFLFPANVMTGVLDESEEWTDLGDTPPSQGGGT